MSDEIEKPWAVHRGVIDRIHIGKVSKDYGGHLVVNYQDPQKSPTSFLESYSEFLDPKYVDRFNTLVEAARHFLKLDEWSRPIEIAEDLGRAFPSEGENILALLED